MRRAGSRPCLRASPIDSYELALAVLGGVAMIAALAPSYLDTRPLSLPIVLVLVGVVVFAVPSPLRPPDPRDHLDLAERATEIGVLVSLVGAGLAIDRPIGLRRWAMTWRLLAIAMPLGIVATAAIGRWWLGLAPPSAMLLGAVLAPTDPVLASDVQVGEPSAERLDQEDEVRVTLTSEAGLNDGLAFPFVYAAIAMVAGTGPGRWVALDLVGRVAIGIVVGVVVGWLLARITFRPPGRITALADSAEGFVAIAAMFLAYGVAELLQGYGFLAVFVAAVTLRSGERGHEYHRVLHDFATQIERLVVVVLLVLLGGALVGGVLDGVSWGAVAVAVAVVVVVRPLTAGLALVGARATRGERTAISFFGIRGIGSLYYLAYAMGATDFARADTIWATVTLALLVSMLVHGVTTTPALRYLDRRRERRGVGKRAAAEPTEPA